MSPRAYRWSGDSFEPLPRFRAECDRELVVGQTYLLETYEERSGQSHRHLFATIADAWGTLPEAYEGRWSSPEHLRAYLLIKTGFCRHTAHPCGSKAEAMRTRAICASMDQYAVVTVECAVVNVFTAESMSFRSMDRKRFQAAKDLMLAEIDKMLGVESGATATNAAEAA